MPAFASSATMWPKRHGRTIASTLQQLGSVVLHSTHSSLTAAKAESFLQAASATCLKNWQPRKADRSQCTLSSCAYGETPLSAACKRLKQRCWRGAAEQAWDLCCANDLAARRGGVSCSASDGELGQARKTRI